MQPKITRETMSQILVRSASLILAIIAYLILSKFDKLMEIIGNLTTILFPFILGFLFAFVLVKPQKYIEKKILAKTKLSHKSKRMISCLIVFVVFILFIVLFFTVTLSGLISSLTTFASNLSIYSDTMYRYMVNISQKLNLSTDMLEGFMRQYNLAKIIGDAISEFVPRATSYSVEFFSGAFDVILALVSALYMLLERESLVKIFKKLNYTFFDTGIADDLVVWINDAKEIFEQFIIGSVIDSFIIGSVTAIAMAIMNMPYAPMIGLIIGITNIIPVFGPFLGAVPVIILLLLISPWKALFFAIFILILQQIDGNVLKPIVLGSRLGISGFWVLFSVTIGGSIAGVPGMFLGVPIFALIFAWVRDYSKSRLAAKKINLDEEI